MECLSNNKLIFSLTCIMLNMRPWLIKIKVYIGPLKLLSDECNTILKWGPTVLVYVVGVTTSDGLGVCNINKSFPNGDLEPFNSWISTFVEGNIKKGSIKTVYHFSTLTQVVEFLRLVRQLLIISSPSIRELKQSSILATKLFGLILITENGLNSLTPSMIYLYNPCIIFMFE